MHPDYLSGSPPATHDRMSDRRVAPALERGRIPTHRCCWSGCSSGQADSQSGSKGTNSRSREFKLSWAQGGLGLRLYLYLWPPAGIHASCRAWFRKVVWQCLDSQGEFVRGSSPTVREGSPQSLGPGFKEALDFWPIKYRFVQF